MSTDACLYIKRILGETDTKTLSSSSPDRLDVTSPGYNEYKSYYTKDEFRQMEYDMRQKFNQQLAAHDKELAHKLKVIGLFIECDGDLNDMIGDY